MYKSSKYNHFFELDRVHYVYNILTTGIIQLDDKCYSALTTNDIKGLASEECNLLFNEGVLVSTDCDETNLFRYYFDRARFAGTASRLFLTFIPTYNCNLRCPYCYEGNKKDAKVISNDEIDAIIKFAENRISESLDSVPIKEIDIQLYGGEPLICKKEIMYFSAEISKLAKKYELKTNFDMVSNLTLLDDQIIQFIKDFDVYLQVSIDGNKEEHNKRRIRTDGQGTYDTIIENLEKLLKAGLRDNVIIRLNSDLQNLENLCDDFMKLTKYSNDVYFGVLTQYKGLNDCFEACIDSALANTILAEKTSKLYAALNIPIPQRFGKKGPCALNSENNFFVDCFLNVYKCDLLINHKECRVGYIQLNGDFIIESNFYNQMAFSPYSSEKCVECKFLPHCAGGCPAEPYLNSGKNDGNLYIYNCAFSDEKLSTILKNYVENQ